MEKREGKTEIQELLEIIVSNGQTLESVATKIGYSYWALYSWMRGTRSPRPFVLDAIKKKYGFNLK